MNYDYTIYRSPVFKLGSGFPQLSSGRSHIFRHLYILLSKAGSSLSKLNRYSSCSLYTIIHSLKYNALSARACLALDSTMKEGKRAYNDADMWSWVNKLQAWRIRLASSRRTWIDMQECWLMAAKRGLDGATLYDHDGLPRLPLRHVFRPRAVQHKKELWQHT